MELAILIALEASGKTTFYRQGLTAMHEPVSQNDYPRARHWQRSQLRLIEEALAEG